MPTDANFTFQSLVTKVATFNGAFIDMKTTPGAPRRGYWIRILQNTFSAGTAGTTLIYSLDDSTDGTNVNATALASSATYTATTTSVPAIVFLQVPGNVKRYARLTVTMAGGTGPQLAYSAAVTPTYP